MQNNVYHVYFFEFNIELCTAKDNTGLLKDQFDLRTLQQIEK